MVEYRIDCGAPHSIYLNQPAVSGSFQVFCGNENTAPDPMFGFVPSAELGTSSTMPKTFLSAKKSLPVNLKPAKNPRRSKKKGSLRTPAKNLESFLSVT